MNKNITDISFSRNNTNEEFVRAIISLRSFRLTNSISALYQIGNSRETAVCHRNWYNLPEHILLAQDNQNTIDYLYDAAGTKLQKFTSSDRAAGLTTDYSGPFVYEDSKLSFFQTSEGRVVPDHDVYAYEYFLRVEAKRKSRNLGNHLGNTRVVFNEQGEVLQNNSYYPFGGMMEGLNYTAGLVPENKYLYNGKEFQDDFGLDWYDYGARFYDAQLGRFHTLDPLSEKYYFQSPFVYGANNPIKYVDINGEGPGELIALYVIAKYKVGKWLGGMADYTQQTSTNNGYRSMNYMEANAKGLESQKAVADISHIIGPVADETNVAVGVGGDVKINDNFSIGVGGEVGTEGVKVYAKGSENTATAELTLDYDGNVDGNLQVAGETIVGNAPENGEGAKSVTIGKGGPYVRVETNPSKIMQNFTEQKESFNSIKESYTIPNFDENTYKKNNRE